MTLEIKGEIEVLRLQPGDKLLVTIDCDYGPLDAGDFIGRIRATLKEKFPETEILVVQGLKIVAVREGVDLSALAPVPG